MRRWRCATDSEASLYRRRREYPPQPTRRAYGLGARVTEDAQLKRRKNEGRTGDQHDAYSIAAWLSRADRDGSLAAFATRLSLRNACLRIADVFR